MCRNSRRFGGEAFSEMVELKSFLKDKGWGGGGRRIVLEEDFISEDPEMPTSKGKKGRPRNIMSNAGVFGEIKMKPRISRSERPERSGLTRRIRERARPPELPC